MGWVLWALAVVVMAGCVETADCDEYVGCESGEVCYQSQCRPTCDGAEDCSGDEVCAPCLADEEGGGSGRCLGADESACIAED